MALIHEVKEDGGDHFPKQRRDADASALRSENGVSSPPPSLREIERSRIPNFLLAGAPKAGTTAIAQYLRSTGKVCFGQLPNTNKNVKEIHLFDHDYLSNNTNSQNQLERYQAYFRHCSQQSEVQPIAIDATPANIAFAEQIDRVYQLEGTAKTEVKILIILREPAARELSWYNHMVHANFVSRDDGTRQWWDKVRTTDEKNHNKLSARLRLMKFEEYMETRVVPEVTDGSLFSYSRYDRAIEKWVTLFDRGQIWIASYVELKKNPIYFLRRLHRFLNLTLPPNNENPQIGRANTNKLPGNVSSSARPLMPSCGVQKSYAQFFEPYNQQLYQVLANHSQGAPKVEKQPFRRFQFRCDKK